MITSALIVEIGIHLIIEAGLAAVVDHILPLFQIDKLIQPTYLSLIFFHQAGRVGSG